MAGTDLPSAAMVQIELECAMVCPDDTQMLDKWGVLAVAMWWFQFQEN